MKNLMHLLKEAWSEFHGHKTYLVAFGVAIYIITAMNIKKLDGFLGTVLLLFDILLTFMFHEIFTELKNFRTQQKSDMSK